ncbi:MAG: hypothetical protein K0S39_2721 [Paenibacillus sp.]|nr:hypothetical protein [Paenibacillus sp.]
MKPKSSYTIWFSQRTGSSLLFKGLESTGVAGHPWEWLTEPDPLQFSMKDIQSMWQQGTTPNGVFGLKISPYNLDSWIRSFRDHFQLGNEVTRPKVWEEVFPECKHIYMTRRNKIRLAVSWWRAIVSGEWHRRHGSKPDRRDFEDQYNYDAINQLLAECVFREACMEAFFAEERIVPMTIVYEDFILKYEETILEVLDFLQLPTDRVQVAEPFFDPIADDITENWVQRFRKERQAGWQNIAW